MTTENIDENGVSEEGEGREQQWRQSQYSCDSSDDGSRHVHFNSRIKMFRNATTASSISSASLKSAPGSQRYTQLINTMTPISPVNESTRLVDPTQSKDTWEWIRKIFCGNCCDSFEYSDY